VSKWLAAAAGLLWLATAPVLAAALSLEPGLLVVARESLPDPRFQRAVVLIVQHDALGTAGLILNRPSRLTLAEVLPSLPVPAGADRFLSYGGPVASRTFMALVKTADAPPQPAQQVFAKVYLTGTAQLAAWPGIARPEAEYRVFAGYAGWAPDQLAHEAARGDWQVLAADEQLLFSAAVDRLWYELVQQPRRAGN